MVLRWGFIRVCASAAATVIYLTHAASAEGDADANDTGSASAPTLVFVPPEAGAPSSRVGAGTRDVELDGVLVVLLVPDGGGLTTREKPPLVWRVLKSIDGTMVAGIEDTASDGGGAFRTIEGRISSGLYALDLERSDFLLKPGRVYRWTVELAEAGSGNLLDTAASYVERIQEAHQPYPADPIAAVRSAAAQGLWFDALAPLVTMSLSGRARVEAPEEFRQLARSANLHSAATDLNSDSAP